MSYEYERMTMMFFSEDHRLGCRCAIVLRSDSSWFMLSILFPGWKYALSIQMQRLIEN